MSIITLTREATALRKDMECERNWPIKVTAVSSDPDLDANIFVYHAAEADDPIKGDTFSNVASLQDMESLPIGAPTEVEGDNTEDYVPYYRTDSVELNCYNLEEMQRIWTIIKRDTSTLVREYELSAKLKETETVEI